MRDYDHVLVVGGAGLSAYPKELRQNVYVCEKDFKFRYPYVADRFKTSYEAMALFFDPRLSIKEKWGYQAQHMDNMSSKFKPNQAYFLLHNFVKTKKSHFVLTSNVDACFTRSGFSDQNVYTPQGEWTYYQCLKRCTEKSVWSSREMLDNLLPKIEKGVLLKKSDVPVCENCGSNVFGNVRGGDWFIHTPYDEAQKRFVKWAQERIQSKSDRVLVIEIGAGFNTPTVTRYPCESFVRELGQRGALIRINPTDPEVPSDLDNAVGLKCGWQVLELLAPSRSKDEDENKKQNELDTQAATQLVASRKKKKKIKNKNNSTSLERWEMLRHHWGHFDWRVFMTQLRR
jgi:NAD-dependent SIR2 family protein deacetylase